MIKLPHDTNEVIDNPRLLTAIILAYSSFVGVFLTLLINLSVIFNYIFKDKETNSYFNETLAKQIDLFFEKFNNLPFTAILVTMALWLIVGIVLYFFLQNIITSVVTIEDDIEISSSAYVHPTNFRKFQFWFKVVIKAFFWILALTIILFWLYISFNVFIPFSTVILMLGLNGSATILESLGLILLSMGTMILMVLGIVIFIKIINNWK